MNVTKRGRVVASAVTIVVVIAAVAFAVAFLGGRSRGPSAAGKGPSASGPSGSPPPSVCPLTGTKPSSGVPIRPALAVKVENLPESRPQTGLSWADIIYEEPVEGGITRFIAVYQCQNASRIEPVRSARLTDPDILDQFGHPLFAYAGGVGQVIKKVRAAGLIDVNYNVPAAIKAYHRDPSRLPPHNLYTSTQELYGVVRQMSVVPPAVFTYAASPPAGLRRRTVHLPFSSSSDVFWRYSPARHVYLRWHGTVPHTLSSGAQVAARNVVVQVVKIVMTDITDANGVHSPEVVATGTGKAYVLRDGRMIAGTWTRPSLRNLTKFVDSRGNVIPLAPGNTWVELFPDTLPITFS